MKISRFKLTIEQIVGIVTFLVILSIYGYSAGQNSIGYGDSDELITTAYLFSVPHPSGYPLLTVLTHFWLQIPIPMNMAAKAHIFAALIQSIAVFILYKVNIHILRIIALKNKLADTLINDQWLLSLIAASASLIWGLSALTWLYGAVFEVGALNNLFVISTIFLVLQWRSSHLQAKNTKQELLYLISAGMAAGLGLSHLQVFVLLMPGMLFVGILTLWQSKLWQQYLSVTYVLAVILPFILTFFASNLLLFFLNAQQAQFSWFFEQNYNGWWNLITRKDFSGFIPDKGIDVSAYSIGIDPKLFFASLQKYLIYTWEHYAGLGIVLGLLGIWALYTLNASMLLIVAVWWLIAGVWFGGRLGLPELDPSGLENRMATGVAQRQFLTGELVWALLVGAGIFQIFVYLKKLQLSQKLQRTIVTLFCLIFIAWMGWQNSLMGVQRQRTVVHDYAQNMLKTAEPDSVIVCFSDVACFSLAYAQFVEQTRPDVTLLVKNKFYRKYFLQQNPQFNKLKYDDNPYFTAGLIAWNLDQDRTVYLTDATQFYIDYMGMDGDPFYLIPRGYLYQVSKSVADDIPDFDPQVTQQLLQTPISSKDYWYLGLNDFFANIHTIQGVLYAQYQNPEIAKEQFQIAQQLSPNYPVPARMENELSQMSQNPRYLPDAAGPEYQEMLETARQLKQIENLETSKVEENLNRAYSIFLKAAFLKPQAKEARWELVKMYQMGQFWDEAKMELENILTFYPDDQEAKELLQKLEAQIS